MKVTHSLTCLIFILLTTGAFADSDPQSIEAAENAINHRNVSALDSLLSSGAVNANDKTSKGTPLLMLAMRQSYINDGADDIAPIVTELLNHGADPNVVEYFRGFPETPMIAALRMGRPKTFSVLIAHHADVNQQTCYVASPGWMGKLFGEHKSLDYGTILDVAQSQLVIEKSIGGGGPDDAQGMGHVTEVNSMISQLRAAGAVNWDPSTMHCDSSNALTPSAVSGQQQKPGNEGSSPLQMEVTLTHAGLADL